MSRNAKGKRPKRGRDARDTRQAHVSRRWPRRRVLFGVILLAGAAAAAFGIARYTGVDARRHDLSAVGNGTPTVVQIHDPSCPVCRELRSNVLSAAGDFSEDTLQIRFADLHTDEGRSFALRHGHTSVTLLFIDGDGNVRDVQSGVRHVDALRHSFEQLTSGEM